MVRDPDAPEEELPSVPQIRETFEKLRSELEEKATEEDPSSSGAGPEEEDFKLRISSLFVADSDVMQEMLDCLGANGFGIAWMTERNCYDVIKTRGFQFSDTESRLKALEAKAAQVDEGCALIEGLVARVDTLEKYQNRHCQLFNCSH
jgi:hypothetical protein